MKTPSNPGDQGVEGWAAGGGEIIGETLPSKLFPHSTDWGTGHWDLQLLPILGVVFCEDVSGILASAEGSSGSADSAQLGGITPEEEDVP